MSTLPDEVIYKIFNYVQDDDAHMYRTTLPLVCKKWRVVLHLELPTCPSQLVASGFDILCKAISVCRAASGPHSAGLQQTPSRSVERRRQVDSAAAGAPAASMHTCVSITSQLYISHAC